MTAPPAPTDAAARWAALRARFAQGLQARRAEIQQAWTDCGDAGPRPDGGAGAQAARQSLVDALHRLAGAAGAYGMADLGEQARALEERLRQGLAGSPALADDLDRLLRAMAREAASAPRQADDA